MATFLTHPFDEFPASRWRRAGAACAVATLLHFGLLLVLPEQMMPPRRAAREEQAVIYEVALVPPQEMRYVEVNPEAPENDPDRTRQFSFRAQQAADEAPLTSADNTPSIDGEADSPKIVQGQIEQAPPTPPGVYSTTTTPGEVQGADGGKARAQAQPQVAPRQPLPAPEFIAQKQVADGASGGNLELRGEAQEVFEPPDTEAPIPVYRPPTQAQADDGSGGAVEARPMPHARPRLAPELITGPLLQSQGSASRRGKLAMDATFSEFGEYQQQFYTAVQAGWYQEIEFFQPIDTSTRVHVRFRLRADGVVDQVEAVQSTASKIATVICVTAISKRSPFRPWTREMVEVFGQERWLNVVFHYR